MPALETNTTMRNAEAVRGEQLVMAVGAQVAQGALRRYGLRTRHARAHLARWRGSCARLLWRLRHHNKPMITERVTFVETMLPMRGT